MADITVQELKNKIAESSDFTLIDVRENHEHEEFNIGGKNLPIGEINTWMPELNDDKSATIVLYCRTGNRSTMAVAFMNSFGYTNALSLAGGVVAWQEAG